MHQFTQIPDFEITKDTCFICGRKANTREHLFPKWLQHEFNLWDQRLIIPNKTSIAYRQLTVPCCNTCNNEVFSDLERKLSTKTESEADVWRWANKVHFALTLKDKFLEWDRRNPGYKIGDVISPNDSLEQSRHFLHCVSGDFKTSPDPFGSVFRFDFTTRQEYNFVHLTLFNSICISFGDRGYVVFVRDGQYLKNNRGVLFDFEELQKKTEINMYDMLFFYAKNIEYMARFNITIPVAIMPKQIVKLGAASVREERPVNKELLSVLCERLGITWIDSDMLPK